MAERQARSSGKASICRRAKPVRRGAPAAWVVALVTLPHPTRDARMAEAMPIHPEAEDELICLAVKKCSMDRVVPKSTRPAERRRPSAT